MARGVAALAGREDLADLTIICQGQEIKCNKIVLAAMSEVRVVYSWVKRYK